MIRVGIIGGAGYTGGELLRLLLNHPEAGISFVHSSSNAGNGIWEVHTDLIGETNLRFTNDFDDGHIDVLFLCSGHGQSKKFFETHKVKDSLKIVDLSHDFRINDSGHFRPFVYGLCEPEKEAIKKAQNIANPGCFATCIQLALWPMAAENWIKADIHINAATGSTGAGQSLSTTSHFSWRSNNFSVYKAFNHQHLGEIGQSLQRWQPDFSTDLNFIPNRGCFTRGILSSVYTKTDLPIEQIREAYAAYYAEHPFVAISEKNIDLKQVLNTNKCILYLEKHEDKLLIISVIDNLIKGASGQAIQNMNLMCGLDEQAGLKLKSTAF
ncbi:MAG: N-acetyl-gamma-glutamyl-phosphate reductase [Cyclobacteriaceae bacterium]